MHEEDDRILNLSNQIASINPNPRILQKLLELSKEFDIKDDQSGKPIHYAAVSDHD